MKKILSLILCFAVVLCTLPFGAVTVSAETSGIYTYTVSNGEATITDCNTSISGEVTIPSTLGGYPVTRIGYQAFSYCSSLTSITIPDSVTSIGDRAFYDCSSLTSITIPDSVTSIGDRAFYFCSSLTSITIPDSVTSIGSYAFSFCDSLTSITIPDSVTSIGSYAFSFCSSLTSVTIGNSVTSIGSCAFQRCSSLKSITVDSNNDAYSSLNGILFNKSKTTLVCYPAGKKEASYTIPDSVTSIGDYAFYYCSSLTSVTIPDSVTSIGYCVFEGCSSLTSVTIGNNVTSIGTGAFFCCSSLTSITIPDSVTSIGDSAFGYCSSLTSITIPDSVTSIGDYAFNNTGYYNDSSNWKNDVLYISNHLIKAKDSISGSYTIKSGTKTIADSAFSFCSSLTSITIPDSVTSIGDSAFGYCSSLKTVYYCGTESEWNKISIGSSNSYLINATRNYHNFGDWIVRTNPTCTTDGEKYRKCSSCTTKETQTIAKLGHNYSSDFTTDKEATLFEEGSKSKHCSRCDSVTDVTVIPKTSVADGVCGENALWAISENGTLVIIGNGATTGYKFNIYTPWYDYSEQITSIEVANTITSIGNRNFNSLTNVKDVIINNPDTTFGYYVFPTNGNTVIHSFGNSDVEEYAKNNNIIFEKFANPETPINPVLVKRSGYSVELKKIEGYEYSVDGDVWQESNVFTSLESGKTYSFYQRIKSGVYAPSKKSEVLKVTTLVAPSAPVIESIKGNTATLKKINGYEYSLDGKIWQTNNVFTNLPFDKVISFYQRVAENGTDAATPASKESKFLIVSAPKVLVGGMSLKVKPISGYEYCLDDMVWQDSNIFEGLIPEETYTVYQQPKNTNGITVAYNNTGTTVVINDNDPITSPNATNLAWLKKLLLKSDKSNNLAADFNNDGEIDIRDLVSLKKALA